jgi:hypothetical protein
MTEDEKYLNLLSIFHYVVAGLGILFSCIFFIHIAIGIAMLCGAMDQGSNPPPRFLGIFFIVFPSLFIMAAWILAGFVITSGVNLKRRRYHNFCMVIAAVECIMMPFGTILGVFTIILLMKDSVKKLFEMPQTTT